jgi:plastocyanin
MNVSAKMWSIAARFAVFSLLAGAASPLRAEQNVTVTAQLRRLAGNGASQSHKDAQPSAAIWLTPLRPANPPDTAPGHTYTLLQKNKMFLPHLLVIPVGSAVQFPNADPFFHNVFSLFDGRRFDLGLYEAGSVRTVTFSREGISYIFCNIHPEMSAVVIALTTRFYAVEDAQERFRVQDVPPGDYTMHVWVQGVDQAALDAFTQRVHISADHADLGTIGLPEAPRAAASHPNKYGQTYDTHELPIY